MKPVSSVIKNKPGIINIEACIQLGILDLFSSLWLAKLCCHCEKPALWTLFIVNNKPFSVMNLNYPLVEKWTFTNANKESKISRWKTCILLAWHSLYWVKEPYLFKWRLKVITGQQKTNFGKILHKIPQHRIKAHTL